MYIKGLSINFRVNEKARHQSGIATIYVSSTNHSNIITQNDPKLPAPQRHNSKF